MSGRHIWTVWTRWAAPRKHIRHQLRAYPVAFYKTTLPRSWSRDWGCKNTTLCQIVRKIVGTWYWHRRLCLSIEAHMFRKKSCHPRFHCWQSCRRNWWNWNGTALSKVAKSSIYQWFPRDNLAQVWAPTYFQRMCHRMREPNRTTRRHVVRPLWLPHRHWVLPVRRQ